MEEELGRFRYRESSARRKGDRKAMLLDCQHNPHIDTNGQAPKDNCYFPEVVVCGFQRLFRIRAPLYCVSELNHSSSLLGARAARPLRAPQGARILPSTQLQTFCSRCALTAGGPPALPVKSSRGQMQKATKGWQTC